MGHDNQMEVSQSIGGGTPNTSKTLDHDFVLFNPW